MATAKIHIEHCNESIMLVIVTDAGESGINPTTDDSCQPSEPVRLRQTTELSGWPHTSYDVDAWGIDAAGSTPHWIEIPLPEGAADAILRLCPTANAVSAAAEFALKAEHDAGDDEDAWISAQNKLRPAVDAALKLGTRG